METVAIFGVGLIGGSFALALRKAGYSGRILGVGPPEIIARALELKAIDEGAAACDAAASADLIYLAEPILRIVEMLPQLNEWVRPETLITDAGSTKQVIVERAGATLSRCQFLGGHPLAGSERRGVESAQAELFEQRPYVLTPLAESEMKTPAASELYQWIQRIGAYPIVLNAQRHDQVVAYTSHLPQLASTALASMLDHRTEAVFGIFGPGLVDSTRLALSSYDVWGDILATNSAAIHDALRSYIVKLEEFSLSLEPARMREQFAEAARFAAGIRGPSEAP